MISKAASGTNWTTLNALSPISSLHPVIAFNVSTIPFCSSVSGVNEVAAAGWLAGGTVAAG